MRYAVVLPGSGSSADFVTRAFAGPLAAAGYRLHAVPPGGSLTRAVAVYEPVLVGGVSLGAHRAAAWAGALGGALPPYVAGLLLVLPAWTGAPRPVGAAGVGAAGVGAAWPAAAASLHAAARVEAVGTAGALAEAERGAEPWVAAELAAAWPAYGDGLAAHLRATAATPGPSEDQLRAIRARTGVLAFADDPLHPLAVAEHWAGLIPRARLRTLALADPAADRAVLGTAALAALAAAPAAPEPAAPEPAAPASGRPASGRGTAG